MNYQLIRRSSVMIRSNRLLSSPNTLKLAQNLLNSVKYLHVSVANVSPRFTKELKNEISSEPPKSINKPDIVNTEVLTKKSHKVTQNNEDSSWDEVEGAMFHTRKAKGVEIPKISFKGNRAVIRKEKSFFNMEEIDRKSMKENVPMSKPNKVKPVKKISVPGEVYDQDIGKYLNLERDDPLLDKLLLKIQSKKHKDLDQKFVLEGRRLIQEAIEAGLKLEILIFSKIEQVKPIKDLILRTKPAIYKVANHNIKLWSQLTTTPGVLGIFDRPTNLNELIEKQRPKGSIMPVSILLDNIREPNNMGAIIRVAAAAGADQIILTKGCTNPWDLKCIRGSSGTHFRIKIVGPVEWSEIHEHLPQNFEYYIADNQMTPLEQLPVIDYDSLDFEKSNHEHKVLVIGGEAHGVSDEARNVLSEILQKNPAEGAIVRIPLVQNVNSLNVASALSVVLFEMRRKLKIAKREY